MEETTSLRVIKKLSIADIQQRVATAKSQVFAGECISSEEAHRIIKCHILGLD